MKKLFLFATAAMMLASCSTDTTQDVAPIVIPGELHVSIDDEESRMQLSDEKTVWTAGDKVSVFYKSDANQCWKFNGNTGDRSGTLSCVSQGTATSQMEKVVIVYPYSESYKITPSTGNIEAKLPAVQQYLQGSYGLESSPMISSGYYTQFALKNVCGWLKLQFSGTGTVTKITLKGNSGEQLAGNMYIDAETAAVTLASASVDDGDNQETGGTLVFEDSIVKEVELDCTGGVDLSASNVTPFYIALLPTVFEKGFTATLHFDNGTKHDIATSKRVEITRNHIVPMETSEITVPEYDYIDIKYVTSNKRIIDNSAKNSSWWSKVVSNTYDTENNVGTLVLPKGSSIGDYAFQDVTGLLSIEIPDNMKGSIARYAFYGCTALKSITIGNGITSIGFHTFDNCSSLTSITIPDSVTEIGVLAFRSCSNLTSVTIPDSVMSIGTQAFFRCSKLTGINIPYSVTTIGHGAFDSCSSLTSVTIGNGVTSIGEDTFHDCSSLTGITIPDSVTSIGDSAFYGCSSLTSIIIPDSVTVIGNGAFHKCSNLKSITIPDSVTAIGSYTFTQCRSLTSITIPDSVTAIGSYTFSQCSRLTSITIGNGITSIGNMAFYGCSSLTSITIPDSVTSIGHSAFHSCSKLTSIYCKPTTPPTMGSYVFNNISSSAKIYVPMMSVDANKSATTSSENADKIVGYDF